MKRISDIQDETDEDTIAWIPPREPVQLKELLRYEINIDNVSVSKVWTDDTKAINDYVADTVTDWEVQGIRMTKEREVMDMMTKRLGYKYCNSKMYEEGLTRLYEAGFAKDSAKVSIRRMASDVML